MAPMCDQCQCWLESSSGSGRYRGRPSMYAIPGRHENEGAHAWRLAAPQPAGGAPLPGEEDAQRLQPLDVRCGLPHPGPSPSGLDAERAAQHVGDLGDVMLAQDVTRL
jgi:hypothetical protein